MLWGKEGETDQKSVQLYLCMFIHVFTHLLFCISLQLGILTRLILNRKDKNGVHQQYLTKQYSGNTLPRVNWNTCLHFCIISFIGFPFHYVYFQCIFHILSIPYFYSSPDLWSIILFHNSFCIISCKNLYCGIYINTQWCQREVISDWKLEMSHSDSWLLWVYWNELFWFFFPLNLSLSELTHSHGIVQFWQSSIFWQQTLSRKSSTFLCHMHLSAYECVCGATGQDPTGTGSWWPQRRLGSRSSDCSPDDGFWQPRLPPSWCWKGDGTPECPNRDEHDFASDTRQVNTVDLESWLAKLKSIPSMNKPLHEINVISAGSVCSQHCCYKFSSSADLPAVRPACGVAPVCRPGTIWCEGNRHGRFLGWSFSLQRAWGERRKMDSWTCLFSWAWAGELRVGGISDWCISEEKYMNASIRCPTTTKGDENCYPQVPFSPSHFLLWALRFSKYSAVY